MAVPSKNPSVYIGKFTLSLAFPKIVTLVLLSAAVAKAKQVLSDQKFSAMFTLLVVSC